MTFSTSAGNVISFFIFKSLIDRKLYVFMRYNVMLDYMHTMYNDYDNEVKVSITSHTYFLKWESIFSNFEVHSTWVLTVRIML